MKKKIKDKWIKSYEIKPPISGIFGWGAKGVIYSEEGEEETEEFWGKTKEEAEQKARKKLKEIINHTSKRRKSKR